MYALTLITPPAVEPISLEEAKLHLREDESGQDTEITAIIKAARTYCEGFLSRAFVTQTWELALDSFPSTYRGGVDSNAIILPRAPLQSVVSITYVDAAGSSQTLAGANYSVDIRQQPGRVIPAYGLSWPTLRGDMNAVVVRFTAGYGNAAAVPENIKNAMRLLIGHWYENREDSISGTIIQKVPTGVEALLWQERLVAF